MILDESNLTTPKKLDKHVLSFCRSLSNQAPVFLDVQPELWCRQSNCEMNVDKYIEENGGNKVIGYKVWYTRNKYIEAERHVVYQNVDGSLIDLTFNTDGEETVLFLADDSNGYTYDDRPLKERKGLTVKARHLVDAMDLQDQTIQQMSPEESWESMPTYEQWLNGVRSPNLLPKF
ncbi:hypothetical protein E2K20_25985 [Vibrio parahaemolyticus]|nr:hypothetical protein [Vibrio parahaemolyticus]